MGFLRNIMEGPSAGSSPDLSYLLDPKRYGDPDHPLGSTDALFQQLIDSLSGPSSVDEAQSGINSEMMKKLLEGIDTDTTKAIGDSTMDFASRGLAGPGQLSDIEANAAGDLRSKALINKDKTRLGFATSELDTMAEREKAKAEAMSQRAQSGVSLLSQLRGLKAGGDTSYASGITSLYNNKSAQKKRGWLGLAGDTFAAKFGAGLGEDASGGVTDLVKAYLLSGGS